MEFTKDSAPLLIVLGQSNAHAHGTHLTESEIIRAPLKNVHGLARIHNQAYRLTDVTWSGFTTAGMNLGEDSDNTCCLANYFAAMWQNAIDSGKELPDLYVIQASVCAQGVAEFEVHGWNMWYAMRRPVLKPGPFGQCDISLYPLVTEILSLAVMNLMAIAVIVPQKPKLLRNLLRPLLPALIMGGAVYGVYRLLGYVGISSNTIVCGVSILVGVLVYFVCAVLLKSITASDCRLLPKGDKLAKLLKL